MGNLSAKSVGILIVVLAVCISWVVIAESAPTIKVGAIFAVTGGSSNLGAPEANTVRMFVDKINKSGGVNGYKIELIVKDSQTNPEKAVLLARQLIDEDKVLAIIGPSTTGETLAIKDICQQSKTILIACAAAEDIVNPVASYVFKTIPDDSDAARRILQVMKAKKISRIGVVTSNDAFGIAGNRQLSTLADLAGIKVAFSEAYDTNAADLTEILTKMKSQDVQAVVNWSAVPAQSVVAKNMKQVGLNVPLFQSHGYGNIKCVQESGKAADGTILPCVRLLVAEMLPDGHPQKKLLVEYKKEYESRFNEEASSFGGYAYDAMSILVEAIKRAGSSDREKVRAAIENLKDFVGTAGTFNFSSTDHSGLGMDAFEMLIIKDGKFVLYKN